VAKIICHSLSGLLTFAYSGLHFLALFGIEVGSSLRTAALTLGPLFAFPLFLIVFLSLRSATIAIWIFFVTNWTIHCGLQAERWGSCLSDSAADKALLAAVFLITISYGVSFIGGNLASLGPGCD